MLDINKCIWITGASTGIGKTLALKLAEEGFKVAASARSLKNLKQLKNEAKSFNIEETMKLYRELDEMSLAEAIDVKYKIFLKKSRYNC